MTRRNGFFFIQSVFVYITNIFYQNDILHYKMYIIYILGRYKIETSLSYSSKVCLEINGIFDMKVFSWKQVQACKRIMSQVLDQFIFN